MFGMVTRAQVRSFATTSLKIVNDVAKQQIRTTVAGADAVLSYDKNGNNITFVTTQVPEQCQGKGVGKALAKYAFDFAQESKLSVICKCHFLAKYYEENKNKYQDLKVKLELE